MNYLFLAIFVVFTGIHLYASAKQDKNLRAITKPVILLSLLGFYLESVTNPAWFIALALVFSWLGDILLIPHGLKWFTFGGISFLLSHIFFILGFIYLNPAIFTVQWYIVVPFALVYGAISIYVFIKLIPYLKKALLFPMCGYLLVNGAMNCFAWLSMFAAPTIGTIITAIGAFMFFVSDCTLFFVRFKKDSKIKTHFFVMLPYSLGEFLIVLGLIFLL